mmetsp:Transcript_57270/g.149211  ORF Transcript_57270/g.149211 Transcript_57270/m.149211 type:complete len:290 (-) Transcript_57270:243-1112(-)
MVASSDLLCHLGHLLEEVPDKAIVSNLEDWRIWVLVDRNNGLRVLHARQMLNGAADAHGHIELGRHDLAGLADLQLVRHEAGINCCTRCAERGIQFVTKGLEDLLEVLTIFKAAAPRDHTASTRELRLVALLLGVAEPLDARALQRLHSHGLHGRRARLPSCLESRGTEGEDLHRVAALDRGNSIACVHGPAEDALLRAHRNDICHWLHVELGGEAGQGLLAKGAGDAGDNGVRALALERQEELRGGVGHRVLELIRLGEQDLAHAIDFAALFGHIAAPLPEHQHVQAR